MTDEPDYRTPAVRAAERIAAAHAARPRHDADGRPPRADDVPVRRPRDPRGGHTADPADHGQATAVEWAQPAIIPTPPAPDPAQGARTDDDTPPAGPPTTTCDLAAAQAAMGNVGPAPVPLRRGRPHRQDRLRAGPGLPTPGVGTYPCPRGSADRRSMPAKCAALANIPSGCTPRLPRPSPARASRPPPVALPRIQSHHRRTTVPMPPLPATHSERCTGGAGTDSCPRRPHRAGAALALRPYPQRPGSVGVVATVGAAASLRLGSTPT